MNFKYLLRLSLFIVLVSGISSSQASDLKKASVFAQFKDDSFTYGTCSCLQNYTCTSSSSWNGVASFIDPIPSGTDVVISEVSVTMTGDPFCNNGNNNFHLGLSLNDVPLHPLQQTGSYNCYCHCLAITNSTNFPNGFTGYNRGGSNSISTSVGTTTVACFQGYQVTLSYYVQQNNSPSPLPLPSSSPAPSPSKSSSGSTPYVCCVYVGTNGNYDVTCSSSSTCYLQEGYTLITQHGVQSCNECFAD